MAKENVRIMRLEKQVNDLNNKLIEKELTIEAWEKYAKDERKYRDDLQLKSNVEYLIIGIFAGIILGVIWLKLNGAL